MPHASPRSAAFWTTVIGLVSLCPLAASQSVVPGYNRVRDTEIDPALRGRVLVSELNCHSCHALPADSVLPPRQAPVLTAVGGRANKSFIRRFLASPQETKPGTTMPAFHGLSGAQNHDKVEALTAFLTEGRLWRPTGINAAGVRKGESLFHSVGCAACHGDLRTDADQRPSSVVPLGHPEQKYTVSSLTEFLGNPHAVRPSGRMPSLNLSPEEARHIASYLMRDMDASLVTSSMDYELFQGSFESLPDFSQLTPIETGSAIDFDLQVTSLKDTFALRFTGYLQIPQDGDYRFWLKSDDGSRLIIDDRTVIDHDGVHAETERSERTRLTQGPHKLVVEYFEYHGGEFLTVEIAGGGVSRQSAANVMTRTETPPEPRQAEESATPELIMQGRALFASLGCAACHQYAVDDQQIEWTGTAPPLNKVRPDEGCLAADDRDGVPHFALSDGQIHDLQAAIAEFSHPATHSTEAKITETLVTLNCVACHQRNGLGGVPSPLNGLFTGTIPEMGDEGRIPPTLDGAGDKLNPQWLTHIFNDGARDRPYMRTRMPRFGTPATGGLVDLLVTADQKTEVDPVTFPEPMHRVKADARLMVGDQALSCIKCHSFDPYQATGIQAMDLTTMTRRLRRDWFHRYLLDPQAYRSGTRMPAAWPNGRSVVPHILDPSPAVQIEAIWEYLSDGKAAKVPSGLIAEAIELTPVDRPIIYRNFIEGVSPRGIAVGFPEKAHLAWDADQMTVRLIWHNAFIDASKHWIGRGPGNQAPLGDHVMALPTGPAVAALDSPNQPWPSISDVAHDMKFLGYRLDGDGRPVFRYRWGAGVVTDSLVPVIQDRDAAFQRTLTLTGFAGDRQSYVRVATGNIEQSGDVWLVNQAIRISDFTTSPVIRNVNGTSELLIPLQPDPSGQCQVRYLIHW